jgi:hypothetical protein
MGEQGPKGCQVLLPRVAPELQAREPSELFHAIRKGVGGTAALIAIFTPGDVSVAIETTMAAVDGKKIVLVAETPEDVPRLLRGLPGATVMGPEEFERTFMDTIEKLVRSEPSPATGEAVAGEPSGKPAGPGGAASQRG